MAFGWIGRDVRIRVGGQEREEVAVDLTLLGLPRRSPVRPDPGEAGQRPVSRQCEPDWNFLAVRPVSYSEKDVKGTMQRFAGPSQRRQCGDAVLRTFVTPGSVVAPFRANAGDGMPQRAIAEFALAVRHPDDRRRIVGEDARHWRQVASRSRLTRNSDRIASCAFVIEYKLQMWTAPHLSGFLGW